jgi:hypothetical protein
MILELICFLEHPNPIMSQIYTQGLSLQSLPSCNVEFVIALDMHYRI